MQIGSVDPNKTFHQLGLSSMEAETASNSTLAGSSRRESQAPGSALAPVNQNLAKPKKTKKAKTVDGRQGQNHEETAGSQPVSGLVSNESPLTFSGQGSIGSQSSAKAGPSVEQQDESRAQLVIYQESGPQLRVLDLSSMSVGSGILDISTGAMIYPDAAKPRAPDGLYRLGNSVVSVVTTPKPMTEEGTHRLRELDKARKTQLESALVEQQEEIWKMRERNEAQIAGVTRQMEALTVRAESKAVITERTVARMNRAQTTEESAEREARIAQDKIIASLSTEAQGTLTAPQRRPSLVAQLSTSAGRSPVQPQLPPTVVPSASSNSTDSLVPRSKNKEDKKDKKEKKNKKPKGKAQNTPQSKPPAPPKPKVNQHVSKYPRSVASLKATCGLWPIPLTKLHAVSRRKAQNSDLKTQRTSYFERLDSRGLLH